MEIQLKDLVEWTKILQNPEIVLNVADSRESRSPGIQKQVAGIIKNAVIEVNGIRVEETKPKLVKVLFFPDLRTACGTFKNGLNPETIG